MSHPKLDRRALGLMLSHLANATVDEILAGAPRASTIEHAAYRIGVTGPPGAGKSTLVGRLAQTRAQNIRMGVLAIDPSSPKSGGPYWAIAQTKVCTSMGRHLYSSDDSIKTGGVNALGFTST